MKSEPVYLDELNYNSNNYKVKVKVIEKTRPAVSPNKKKTTYQNVILQDDKGNKMRGTLFGEQIESYREAFVYNGVYEISNAPIKPIDDKYRPPTGMLEYEMGFGRQTFIQPFGEGGEPTVPDYVSLGKIPRAASNTERFDVLGIVLYADSKARPLTTKIGHETILRDIVITDHSSDQPITVTLWSDLAEADNAFLGTWAERFIIVGFTALKVYSARGFALSTSMSTLILEDPEGPRAKALRDWVNSHEKILHDRRNRLLDVKDSSTVAKMTTIAALKARKVIFAISKSYTKPSNTLQDERLWITVYVNDADLDQIYAYLACSICRRRPDGVGRTFASTTCAQGKCIICPRVTFACQLTDETGSLAVTAYTEDSEKLLQAPAEDIFHMKHDEDYTAFEKVRQRLKKRRFKVQMGPHTNLSRNNILQWVLKSVEQHEEDNRQSDIEGQSIEKQATAEENSSSAKKTALCTDQGTKSKGHDSEQDLTRVNVLKQTVDKTDDSAPESSEEVRSPASTLNYAGNKST